MHIAVLTNEFEPAIIGGLGIVATDLAEALRARGHTLLVITRGSSLKISDQEHAGMRVIRFPAGSEYHSRMHQRLYAEPILHYLRHLRDWPAIIHVHSLQADRLAIAMRDKCSARIVYTCHSLVSNEGLHQSPFRHMESRQRHFMEEADIIVSPSTWQALALMAHCPATRGKTHVIPNGVNPHSVSVLDRPRRSAQLLFAGRLIRQKGVAETIAAVADLKNIDRQVRLDIIGDGSMKYVRELKSLANRLKVSGRVRFLGQCTHHTVLQRMRDAGVVIMPSSNESFGLVALEAMAAGTPDTHI
ncbi:MAG: glycosyltransferase family 4 protein [Bacilli bacterium]